jgi:SAM-dependent methyltransferase
MNVWDERAEAYRASDAHREGADLDLLVEWAAGAVTALDVGTGGGHVARRLREAGVSVVSTDPAPGMQPDVVCRAEDLPFDDASFDLVVCRVAAHHFEDVGAALAEMARVARKRVLVVDNLHVSEAAEQADRVRDPSHVRNYTEEEWRALFAASGLAVEDVRIFEHRILFEPWLERVGCEGPDAARVRALVVERIDGEHIRLPRVAIRGRKS